MIISWIITIIVGAIIGWIASLIMKTDTQQGTLVNIIVGIVGAFLGSWLFGNILGFNSANAAGTFSIAGFFWGVIGAIILIAILRLFRVFY